MSATMQNQALAEVQVAELGDLSSLLKKEFKPRTDSAEQAVEAAVHTLAQRCLTPRCSTATWCNRSRH